MNDFGKVHLIYRVWLM